MSKAIKIVGTGPGHPQYTTPAAWQAIRQAQVLIGGRRLLEDFAQPHQQCCVIDKDLPAVLQFILNQPPDQDIAVLVSGDPGFFSMGRFLKKRLRCRIFFRQLFAHPHVLGSLPREKKCKFGHGSSFKIV